MMRRYMVLGLLPFAFAVACTRQASVVPTSTPTPLGEVATSTSTPLALTEQPILTVLPATSIATEPPTATLDPSAAATATPASTATVTPTPSDTPTEGPTSTPLGPAIDPVALWGDPTFVDKMDSASITNWAGADGFLPDTENIRLELKDDQLFVTGKKLGFETWWFSWPVLDNAYLEARVRTDTCSQRDAYGMIVRGPLRGAGTTFGYVVSFSCDGQYRVRRIDGTSPFVATDLTGYTESNAINQGPNQENLLGIQMEGDVLSIYANRVKIAEITDSNYRSGRYGVFVTASSTPLFTYRVEELAFWDFGF